MFFGVAVMVSLMAMVGLDFTTYQQLTSQQEIIKVHVTETSEGQFTVKVTSDDSAGEYELVGDQWQIDFRLIRFSPLVSLSGLSYLYQPSRLSNRYQSIDDQRSKPLFFYSLRDEQAVKLDLWQFFRDYSHRLPMIDATFGSSVFMPLIDNAEYNILIGFSGLVVKAANENGLLALQHWQ